MEPKILNEHFSKVQEKLSQRSFGVSAVQRLCRIGYKDAEKVISSGLKQGVFIKDTEKEWLVRVDHEKKAPFTFHDELTHANIELNKQIHKSGLMKLARGGEQSEKLTEKIN